MGTEDRVREMFVEAMVPAAPRYLLGVDAGSEVLRCVDDRRADVACSGTVELRESLTGTGTPIARCGGHWSLRLDYQREHNGRFSDRAPADFDESYAGERWDEED